MGVKISVDTLFTGRYKLRDQDADQWKHKPLERVGYLRHAELLRKSTWLRHLIGNEAPPAARDSNKVACALNLMQKTADSVEGRALLTYILSSCT